MSYKDKVEKKLKEILQENELPTPLPTFDDLSEIKDNSYIPTGFEKLDENLGGGLIRGVSYLLSAVEKAGKSSFLRRMVFQMLSYGHKVAYIDIEQSSDFALKSMSASATDKNISEVTKEDMQKFKSFASGNLIYITRSNSGDLIQDEDRSLSVTKCINTLRRSAVEYGSEVLVFDNVTPFASEGQKASSNQRMKIMGELVKLAPETNTVVIVVGHVNENTREHKKDTYLEKMLEAGTPEKAMDEGTTLVRKPSAKDVFGGSILTQFGGKMFIWRPYQSHKDEFNQKFAWLIMSSSRYTKDFSVPMEFKQGSYSFVEKEWATENAPLWKHTEDLDVYDPYS